MGHIRTQIFLHRFCFKNTLAFLSQITGVSFAQICFTFLQFLNLTGWPSHRNAISISIGFCLISLGFCLSLSYHFFSSRCSLPLESSPQIARAVGPTYHLFRLLIFSAVSSQSSIRSLPHVGPTVGFPAKNHLLLRHRVLCSSPNHCIIMYPNKINFVFAFFLMRCNFL